MTVDEVGKSLIILLPNKDGSVGVIDVMTSVGKVTLNQAFQATVTTSSEVKPSKPVLLLLSESAIDNMLIVAPPEDAKGLEETSNSKANILDLSELDIDYLKNTELEKDDLQLSSLDVDPLNANFLEDYLATSMGGSSTKDGVTVNGTGFGYDPTTQIYTIIAGDKVQFTRSVGTTVVVNVEKDKGKVLNINAGGKEYSVQVNEGGTNINLKQSN
jgi:hypothetical protein